MKRFLVLFMGLMLAAAAARAQNEAAEASRQAARASQQASDAWYQAQQQQFMDNAMAQSANAGPAPAATPKFSLKAGKYSTPQKLILTVGTRRAAIYYTTNGWMPTTQARRYTGPITVSHTERVQAFAVAKGLPNSAVNEADYTLPGAAPAPKPVVAADGVLHSGMRIPLVFASAVDSKTAKVGDAIQLRLASDLEIGARTIQAPAGTASGVVTAVQRPTLGGGPGEVTFLLNSVTADGVRIPVYAKETALGKDRSGEMRKMVLIPVVNVVGLMTVHGQDAEIEPDTPVVATVMQDTRLP